jgi:hypothetical protein
MPKIRHGVSRINNRSKATLDRVFGDVAPAVIPPSFYAIRTKTPETGLSTSSSNLIVGYDTTTSAVISLVGLTNSGSPYNADSWRLVSRNYDTGVINWVKKITPDGDFFGVSGYSFNLSIFPIGIVNSKIFVYMTNYLSQRIVAFNLDGTVFLSKEISSSFVMYGVVIDSNYNAYVAVEEASWDRGKSGTGQTFSILGYNLLTGTKLSNTANPQHGVVDGNTSVITGQKINSSGDNYWLEYTGGSPNYNYVLRNSNSQLYQFLETTTFSQGWNGKQLTDDSFAYYRRFSYYIEETDTTTNILNLYNYEISSLMNYITSFDVADGSRFSIGTPTVIFYEDYAYIIFSGSGSITYISKVNSKTGQIYWQKRITITCSIAGADLSSRIPSIDPNGNLVYSSFLTSVSIANANYSTLQYAVFNSDGSNMTGVKTFGAYVFTFADVDSVTFTSLQSRSWATSPDVSTVALRTPPRTLTVGDYSKTPVLTDKTSVYTEIKETI